MVSDVPTVPTDRLATDGWTEVDREHRTRFELPTMRVVGHTVVYEDARLREAVRERIGLDRPWRFFFATRLEFVPPLAPGIGPAMVRPTVVTEARREFADDLRNRGFTDVRRGKRQRVRVETGDRADLTKFGARYRIDPADVEAPNDGTNGANRVRDLPVAGWIAVWVRRGEFRLAGGVYPETGLDDAFDVDDDRLDLDPGAARDALLELIRAVR